MITRVKICCISSREEALLAINYGASALGLVSSMPSGPGVIDNNAIAEIAGYIPPAIASFLLTSQQDPERIIDQQRSSGVNTIQICDRMAVSGYARLRNAMPGVGIVQVIHVSSRESVAEAIAIEEHVDAILLDSGNQSLKIKELGGTGRVHDWSLSREIRESVNVPVFLAGGLNAENVASAIQQVGPFAVDICSGVRTNGKLDEIKLKLFFKAVRDSETNNLVS